MMDMIHDGGRYCQGTSGLLAAQDLGVCEALVEGSLTRQMSTIVEGTDAWCS